MCRKLISLMLAFCLFVSERKRYGIIEAAFARFSGTLREDYGVAMLELVKQDPKNGYDRSNTLTTSIYNTVKKTLRVFAMKDFTTPYDFTL